MNTEKEMTERRSLKLIAIALTVAVVLPEAILGQSAPTNSLSHARSGPATGGVIGTVESLSPLSFVVSTVIGQKVIINVSPTTEYVEGTNSASASVVAAGDGVLVLGSVSGRTITASQVIVQTTDKGGATSSPASGVVPFQRRIPGVQKRVGQIPANYSQGAGTIVSGVVANKATEAALANYPGGIIDRVVELSNGEYEVHNIGVQWPHHIFVSPDLKVVGAF